MQQIKSKRTKSLSKLGYCIPLILSSHYVIAEDTIVVTASGYLQEAKSAPASISVITSQEISNKPYRDVTDALKDIPGVNITGGNDKKDIMMRGLSAKYTLILVDGKRISTRETRPNSDNSGFEQGWLPPLSAIERIEVVRGPMSSLYGSDAMGGVINIITKKVVDEWQGNLRLEGTVQQHSQSKSYYNGSFSVLGPLIEDKLGVQLYGQYSDRHEDNYSGGHPKQKLRSLNSKFSFNATETQQFELELSRALQNTYATEGKSSTSDSERENRRNTVSLSHNGSWDLFSSSSYISYEENDNPVRDMKIENTDMNTQFLVPINNHMITLGGQYQYKALYDSGNQLDANVTSISRWNYALFTEDEWQIHDDFSMTLGVRFNKDELYGSYWNPRIYGVWSIDENYTLKGGFSTGYTTPSLRYVVSDWGQVTGGGRSNGVIIGNPSLAPEKSDNYEMSLLYTNDYGLNMDITAFYTKFKDKIQSYYICSTTAACSTMGYNFDFVQSRENVDKAEVKGIEFSMKTPIFETFQLTTNYAWTKSIQKSGVNSGKSLNQTPRHKFNTQLDYFLNEKWSFWGKVAYYGEEISTGKTGIETTYPGYTLWDLGASFIINDKTTLYSGIYNLFDKKIENDDYGKTLDGRRYWVGIDLNF